MIMIETPPRNTTEYESNPVISYEEYRALCDGMQLDVYRKTGVSSSGDYSVAQEDARTVYIEIDGRRLPLFVPLEHVGGYNVNGTRNLTEREDVYALALPPDFIEESEIDLNGYLRALGENSAVIVQTGSKQTQEVKTKIGEKIAGDKGWAVRDFIDPRCPEGHQTASITVYYSHFESLNDDGAPIPRNDRSTSELYAEEIRENGKTPTELVEAADVRGSEALLEELWDLHNDRFDWLGKFHPVSMQENEEFFRGLLTDDRNRSYVRFESNDETEKVPVCQSIELDDMSQVEWISDRFKEETLARAATNGEFVRFFYGIAGKKSPDKMAHFAKDVMGLNSRLFKRGGGKAVYVFESTNMSSLYMPGLVEQYISEEPEGARIASEIQALSQLDYWYLESPSKVTI